MVASAAASMQHWVMRVLPGAAQHSRVATASTGAAVSGATSIDVLKNAPTVGCRCRLQVWGSGLPGVGFRCRV